MRAVLFLLQFAMAAVLLAQSGTVTDASMRKNARRTVLPEFPQEALTKGTQGVVVADVRISAVGLVVGVDILQAPTVQIAQAVVNALRQWTFRRNVHGQLEGKMFFYYHISHGRGIVMNLAEALDDGLSLSRPRPLRLVNRGTGR